MKRTITLFTLFSKRLLKRPSFLFILFLLPVLTLIFLHSTRNDSKDIKIALYAEDDDSLTDKAINELTSSDSIISFYRCDTLDDFYQDIKSSNAECGYIFTSNLSNNIVKEERESLIIEVISPKSTISKITNEIVYSSIFNSFSYDILEERITSDNIFNKIDKDKLTKSLKGYYDGYFEGDDLFSFNYITYDTKYTINQENDNSETLIMPIRGIVSVMVFITALFSTVEWYKDEDNKLFISLPYYYKPIQNFISIFTPTLYCGIIGTICIMMTSVNIGIINEIINMAIYLLLLTGFCMLFKSFFKTGLRFTTTIAPLTIGSLILCPVFIDIAPYFPQVNILSKLFMPYYFLKIANNNLTTTFLTFILAIIITLLGLLNDYRTNK